MSSKRFRIAFSFAGEKRDFVEKTAAILAEKFTQGKILYDKYHEAEFARYDLGIYLPKFYREESDLVVAVFSQDYDKKRWTGWEWMAIHAQLTKQEGSKVMLTRFDYANPDGLFENAAFAELDNKTHTDFATLILERLATNDGHHKDHYTKTVSITPTILKTSIPHNLPTLQPFFGREDELRKIADALDPDSRVWGALIDGPGGIGKTSLAVRAAYDVSPDIFDRIIFISLKTRELDDDGIRDLSGFLISGLDELFNELARELGRDDILKLPGDQRPRQLIEALRGTQTLLLLDNLESLLKRERDTLFTFIKKLPVGCKAILTSRGRIGSGAEELILEELSEEAALATLAELANHNPLLAKTNEAERVVLYNETAGKPLLLRWTAGQLGRGHCLTFADALHFIRSCPPDNDPLEFIFGDLVQDFSVAETQVLCALTYFTSPASAKDIHAIADPSKEWMDPQQSDDDADERSEHITLPTEELTLAAVEFALRSLVNRSLVVPTDELKSFTLVPMVADFLRKKKAKSVEETGSRLKRRAYALIMEKGWKNHADFPSLEAAWPGVAPALSLFVEGDNERLQTVCKALHKFLKFQGRWDERVALCQRAEYRAIEASDHENAGWRAYQIGMIHYVQRQSDLVFEAASRAADHWQKMEASIIERATVLRLYGLGHRLKAQYADAIVAQLKAIELLRSLAVESEELGVALNELAGSEKSAGDLCAAEEHYREAIRVARSVDDAEGVATCIGNLADLMLDRHCWRTAEALSREALPLSEKLYRKDKIASNHRILAKALMSQDRAAEAQNHARLAVEIYTHLGDPRRVDARTILTECENTTRESNNQKE